MIRLAWFTDTLREWSWRHVALGMMVGSLALFNMGGMLFWPADFPFARSWVYNVFEFGLPFVFFVRVADRAVADGVPRWLAYALVVLGVIAIGVWVIGPLIFPIIGGDPDWGIDKDVHLAFSLLLPFAVATVAYANWRRERDTLERLHSAEIARARQEQLVQSARLLALQTRVEPQFLFDALHRVRNLIEPSAAAAERLLGDLIALLRTMQPAAGATASTLAREIGLVQAYARASEAAALQEPRLQMHAHDDALQARFAPLVLLPALRSLVGDAPDSHWQVGAMCIDGRLRMVITPSANLASAVTALTSLDCTSLQQRLAAVHGGDARLAVSTSDSPALHIDTAHASHDQSPDR